MGFTYWDMMKQKHPKYMIYCWFWNILLSMHCYYHDGACDYDVFLFIAYPNNKLMSET